MQCLARTQQVEKRVTCGVSLLVRLARARRGDPLTRGVALGLLKEMPMVVSASTPRVGVGLSKGFRRAVSAITIVLGDGDSRRRAEWMVESEEAEGLDVLAAASASSSAGGDSNSKGEEGCWVVVAGVPLMVTCSGNAHFASDCSVCCKTSHPCGTDENARLAACLQHQACTSSTPRLRLHAINLIKSCHSLSQDLLSVDCSMSCLVYKSRHNLDRMQCHNSL